MIAPFQVGLVVVEPNLKSGTVDLRILHKEREATLTVREVQMLAEHLVGVLEKAEQEKEKPLKRRQVK